MNRRNRAILTVALSIALAILFLACTSQSAGRQIDDTSLHAVDRFSGVVRVINNLQVKSPPTA